MKQYLNGLHIYITYKNVVSDYYIVGTDDITTEEIKEVLLEEETEEEEIEIINNGEIEFEVEHYHKFILDENNQIKNI